MSEKLSLHFQYPATISEIVALNDSFDSCKLSICYAGKNRNGSIIPMSAIEQALPSMAYCPVVTHYDIETDQIGGHDMKVVNKDDSLRLVNLTNAIGVVPESPECFWEEREDGHSYLCTKALIWKRSAAYETLIENGITAQSMEIDVKTGHMSDDGYVIDNFAFTAFCVIGVDPCFENASVEFSMHKADDELSAMLEDFKHEFSCVPTKVIPASADDNINQSFPKGGENEMNIEELLAKFGLSAEDVADVDLTGMDEQAVEARFAEIAEAKNQPEADTEPAPTPDPEPEPEADHEPDTDPVPPADPQPAAFSLTMEQLGQALRTAVRAYRVRDPYWGEMYSYYMMDCDMDEQIVYVEDYANNAILGVPYTMDGDNVVVDFTCAKKKKIQFVDFDEGSAAQAFSLVTDILQDARVMCDQVIGERDELNTFKLNQLAMERQAQINDKLNEFADLEGNEMFELLRQNNDGMTVEQIESRCFEIRGRLGAAKFALKQDNPIRVPVERNHNSDEPYGGIFEQYGIGKR